MNHQFTCICVDEDEDSHHAPSHNLQSSNRYTKSILASLSFFMLNRHRPGIFVASYLLRHGWAERDIGIVFFLEGISCVLIQTPIGQFVDYTSHKKLIVAFSSIIISASSIFLIYYTSFIAVTSLLCAQAVGIALGFPALYGLTLGLVGSSGIVGQVPLNEETGHAGNAFYASAACLLASHGGGYGLFWFCSVMGLCACIVLFFIDESKIDHDIARGFDETKKSSSNQNIPMTVSSFFSQKTVILFFTTICFFHFANASMLPLLSQHLVLGDQDRGVLFTAYCIIVAQVFMVITAGMCEILVPILGKKNLITFGMAVIPVRGAVIIALHGLHANPYIMISTQVLDGIAGGILGVVAILLAEDLTRGTGRFSMAIGTIKTMESLGASLSNLTGEAVAGYFGYDAAFCVLSLIGLVPMLLYWFSMPDELLPAGREQSPSQPKQITVSKSNGWRQAEEVSRSNSELSTGATTS